VISKSPEPACNYSRAGVGTIVVLLGNGDGTLTKTSTLCFPDFMGELPLHIFLAADYNADGNADIIAESGIHGGYVSIFVYYGHGDGTFSTPTGIFPPDQVSEIVQQPQTLSQVCLPDCVWGFVVGDFDGNGQVGSAVTYTEPAYGYTSLTLLPEQKALKGRIGGGPASLGVGDLNGDGKLDLATLYFPGLLGVFLNDGDGTFTEVPGPAFEDVRSPMVIGDFTGDGILDLAIGDDQSTALTVLKGNGDGTFTQVDGQPGLPEFSNSLATADVNGDGKLDLVWTGSHTISVLLGNGDGTFRPGFIQALPGPLSEVALGDFNGDGRLDLAVTNSFENTVSLLLQTPAQLGRTITLVSDLNPSYVNQPVTYTAVVWANPTPPTGSVTLKRGTTILDTVVLVNGVAKLTTTYEKAGTVSVVANYSGDQNYPPKTSQAVKQVVNRYTIYSGYLSSSLNPSVYGQAINLTYFVYSNAPTPPTGTVTFRNGPSLLGTVPVVNGYALLTKKNLPAGTLSITATYNGDILHNKNTDTLSQVVSQATTTTTVTAFPNPSVVGQNVTFKATVLSNNVAPVGTVTFTAGTTTLGTVSLAGGKASLTTSALPVGTSTVTAKYNGTSNISGSSGAVVQKVN
jgi:hypothetical protein